MNSQQTDDKRKLRGAVFGCGMISEFHLRGWQRIPEVEIVAMGNRTLSRAEARRAEFAPQANVYAELPELLGSEQLDFIDILTPPALHKEHCLEALAAGIHVICQKPIAVTADDAREMVAAAKSAQRTLAIHENHRYRPWFQDIVCRARGGFFGTIRFAQFEQFDPSEPPESYKTDSRTGVLFEYGTHLIDMIHELLGRPQAVLGSAHRLNPRVQGESLVHLTCTCGAATATINIAWKPTGIPHGGVYVVGDRGEAIYNGTMTRGEKSRFRLVEQNQTIVDEARSPYQDYVDSFYCFQRDVVRAWLDGTPVPQPADQNLEVLNTTIAAYQAIERGEAVPVE